MARVRDMHGTPAQLVTLKSDGKRRNIAWCKYSSHQGNHNYLCNCEDSPFYKNKCSSCRNCEYYFDEKHSI